MGQARLRQSEVGECIYCRAKDDLSREHVLPFGLGGDLVLAKASCPSCSTITSKLELKLLRGHWWPYRQILGLPSRRDSNAVPNLPVKVRRPDGSVISAELPLTEQSAAMVFELAPPTILGGTVDDRYPFATKVFMKLLAPVPARAIVDGSSYNLDSSDELDIPINFDAGELSQFLAKVAHGYAINRRGLDSCQEYFLPPIILGSPEGAMTYVGGNSSPFIGPVLPGGGLHALLDRVNNGLLTVCVQLFRVAGDPPPIYEVVVGRLRDAS